MNPLSRTLTLQFATLLFGGGLLLSSDGVGAQSKTEAKTSPAKIASTSKAMKALGHIDATQRRAALIWLADHGLHVQAVQLAPLLKDDDAINRQLAERAMWQMWARSGDARVDRQYSKALTHMNGGDFNAAIESFSGLIRTKPDLAEAWNKRATAYFLAGDLDRSLADCDEVIKRNPVHFGALAGYGQIYTQKGDYERALEYFTQALEVNPNMVSVQINIRGLMRLIDEKRKNTT
jgi:tetratricopeptide (TPR) repeat protein